MSGGSAGAWPALRDTDRDLAFALLFAPHERRDLLADRRVQEEQLAEAD